jgi:hypothetical protein
MPQVVIENPILNSPFAEPNRHFRFGERGITDEIVAGRRESSYFIPIPQARKKAQQIAFDTEWTRDRIQENDFINKVRARVGLWRRGGLVGVTSTTARLLQHWQDPAREHKLFFCQVEALQTAIYIGEVARRDKAAKAATARTLWVPAINNHGGFGRWAFIEISDPWDAMNTIRAFLRGQAVDGVGPLLRA